MKKNIILDSVLAPSEDVVARDIEGEIIIVPLVAGVGDLEEEIYSLNEYGKAIWKQLDGIKALKDIASALADEFVAPPSVIETDLVGFSEELARRGILRVVRK